jgi:uncharacterized phiE125 gp8 family phage protein
MAAPATTLVLSLAAAKKHLKMDPTVDDEEDDLVTDAIRAAQEWVEDNTVLVLTERTIEIPVDAFSPRIALRAWPVKSVDEITYLDRSGTSQAVPPGGWLANLARRPVQISAAAGSRWPLAGCFPGAVTVTVTAGFEGVDAVPMTIMQALKLMVGHFYRNREATVTGAQAVSIELPLGVESLIRKWKRRIL